MVVSFQISLTDVCDHVMHTKKENGLKEQTNLFRTVLTCKQSLICAYFSTDSDETKAILWIEDFGFSWKKLFEVKTSWWICLLQAFCFTTDGLELCGLLVNYCDVFIRCQNSHSEDTRSLLRTNCWASDVMLHFCNSVSMKKQTHLHLGWPEGE